MFLPATNAKPKKKKENEEGLSDSFNGGGLIAAPDRAYLRDYNARAYSAKSDYPYHGASAPRRECGEAKRS